MAYAFNKDECISCTDENMELMEAMGFTVEQTEDGMVITNSMTGEVQSIDPSGSNGACQAYKMCMFFTFWIAYGIFFIPCWLGAVGSC